MKRKQVSAWKITIAFASLVLLSQLALAQSFTTLDTMYTPSGYSDGPLAATVYLPAISKGVGVVLTHGYTANRQSLTLWCDTLAANGYVAMTIDYHDWSDTVKGIYPTPVRAYKIAVEFLRRNANRFGITTGSIAALGQSEGSFHWAETLTWDNDDLYFGTDPAVNDRLDAAILLYGIYDNYHYLQSGISFDAILRKYFSPDSTLRTTKGNTLANIAGITTPILLLHGTNDQTVEDQQSIEFHDSLLAHGKSAELKLFSGQGHVFEFTSSGPTRFTSAGLIAKDTVLAFLRRTFLITDVRNGNNEAAAKEFTLDQNYPNPFNPKTDFRFQIAEFGFVSLKVYDMLGRDVKTLINGEKYPGTYTVTWDATNFSSGVYIYRLQEKSYFQSRKLLLQK
jgi:dienelactone hydrolase